MLTPSPLSAKVEAHWLTACSLAPAQSIITMSTQKILFLHKSGTVIPVSPSATSAAMGVLAKIKTLHMGTIVQIQANILQFPTPKT